MLAEVCRHVFQENYKMGGGMPEGYVWTVAGV